jgi:uncharacterized protein YchJ
VFISYLASLYDPLDSITHTAQTVQTASAEADRVMEILETGGGTPFHTDGTVRFRARYREGGRDGEMVEHSRFARLDGAWVYVDALPA